MTKSGNFNTIVEWIFAIQIGRPQYRITHWRYFDNTSFLMTTVASTDFTNAVPRQNSILRGQSPHSNSDGKPQISAMSSTIQSRSNTRSVTQQHTTASSESETVRPASSQCELSTLIPRPSPEPPPASCTVSNPPLLIQSPAHTDSDLKPLTKKQKQLIDTAYRLKIQKRKPPC